MDGVEWIPFELVGACTCARVAPSKHGLLDLKAPNGHTTKDGRKARYLGTIQTAPRGTTLVFAIADAAGNEVTQKVYPSGRVDLTKADPNDIYDAPAPLKVDDFWMVLADNTNYTKFRHPTHESAVKEALRLSSQISGVKFNVLSCVGAARDGKWVESDIPF